MKAVLALVLIAGCSGASDDADDLRSRDEGEQSSNLSATCRPSDRGHLVSLTRLERHRITLPAAKKKWDNWQAAQALGYITNDYDYPPYPASEFRDYAKFRMAYCSVTANGDGTEVTALLTIPHHAERHATVLYLHGTSYQRIDTPSNPNEEQVFEGPSPEVIFGPREPFIAPDGTAFLSSRVERHQYLHPAEAKVYVDALFAAMQVREYRAVTTGKVAVVGISAGGHTALATTRELEELGAPPTGTAVVGAVTEPDTWINDWLMNAIVASGNDNSYFTGYIAYATESYQSIYGAPVYTNPSAAYNSPYDATVPAPKGFNGDLTFTQITDDVMAPSPQALFKPEMLRNLTSGAFHRLLKHNAVDRWCPKTPVYFYVTLADDEVDPIGQQIGGAQKLASCSDQVKTIIDSEPWLHLDEWHHKLVDIEAWAHGL